MVHCYKRKKYIRACVQAGLASLPSHDREQFLVLTEYVKKHAHALWYVHAVEDRGREIARILFSHAHASFTVEAQNLLEVLFEQLVRDKTLPFLPSILASLSEIMDQEQGIVRAKIFISHSVSPEYAREVIEYFSWLLKKHVIPEFIVEPHLIAGLRFETSQLVWEDSVRQQLRAVSVYMQG